MRLITAHRILILAAIAFFVFFAVVMYLKTGSVVIPLVSLAVAAGLRIYFRSLARWDRR
ncbi:MAG TPA: hypothetical protein VMR23_09110 [Candidatus Limnocylindria bacterium]|nr:hypothetical protein [Candidatus Limnocylindria bacterium]